MKLAEFAATVQSLVAGETDVEILVIDRNGDRYLKVDELAIDAERRNLFVVVNSDGEGAGT